MNVSLRRRAPPVPTSLLCCAGCGGPSGRRTPTEPDQLLGATSAGGRMGTGRWEPLCACGEAHLPRAPSFGHPALHVHRAAYCLYFPLPLGR